MRGWVLQSSVLPFIRSPVARLFARPPGVLRDYLKTPVTRGRAPRCRAVGRQRQLARFLRLRSGQALHRRSSKGRKAKNALPSPAHPPPKRRQGWQRVTCATRFSPFCPRPEATVVPVGMPVARHPPDRSVREELPHTVPASGHNVQAGRTGRPPAVSGPAHNAGHRNQGRRIPLAVSAVSRFVPV